MMLLWTGHLALDGNRLIRPGFSLQKFLGYNEDQICPKWKDGSVRLDSCLGKKGDEGNDVYGD
jgi:hypothetical protein